MSNRLQQTVQSQASHLPRKLQSARSMPYGGKRDHRESESLEREQIGSERAVPVQQSALRFCASEDLPRGRSTASSRRPLQPPKAHEPGREPLSLSLFAVCRQGRSKEKSHRPPSALSMPVGPSALTENAAVLFCSTALRSQASRPRIRSGAGPNWGLWGFRDGT